MLLYLAIKRYSEAQDKPPKIKRAGIEPQNNRITNVEVLEQERPKKGKNMKPVEAG
jgi:hypothetical protein